MGDRSAQPTAPGVEAEPRIITLPERLVVPHDPASDDDAVPSPPARRMPLAAAAAASAVVCVLAVAFVAGRLLGGSAGEPSDGGTAPVSDALRPDFAVPLLAPLDSAPPSALARAGVDTSAGSDPAALSSDGPQAGSEASRPGAVAAGSQDPTSGGGSTSVDPVPLSPPVPTLSVYLPSAGASTNGADGRASLRAVKVSAGSGEIASVTINRGGATTAMTRDAAGTYAAVIEGLTNGTAYRFIARVCNTKNLCTDSAPLSYVPYGTPTAGSVNLTVSGTQVTVTWTASFGNAYPYEYDCALTLTSTPDDAGAPSSFSAGRAAGSRSFTGQPGTSYQALKRCGTGRAVSAVRSGAVGVAAAADVPGSASVTR